MNGSRPGRYSKHDGADLIRDGVSAAFATVVIYWFGQGFPGIPEEARLFSVVLLFAGLKFLRQLVSDTRWL